MLDCRVEEGKRAGKWNPGEEEKLKRKEVLDSD